MNLASVSHIRSHAMHLTIGNINQPIVLLRIDNTKDNQINAFGASLTSIVNDEGASLEIIGQHNLISGK